MLGIRVLQRWDGNKFPEINYYPAGKRDEATHHAVEKSGDKWPNVRGGGGGGGIVILREAFGCS